MKKNTSIRSGVCIVKNNKVLILKESAYTDHPNKWTLPGGHGEKNETFLETAIRETQEEIGLTPKISGIVSMAFLSQPKDNVFLVIYKGSISKNAKIKVDNQEIVSFSWVTLEDLENDRFDFRHPIIKEAIMRVLTHKPIDKDSLRYLTTK